MNKLPYLLSIIIIVILDQLSKWYVLEEMLLQKAYPHKQPRDIMTWFTEVNEAYLPPTVSIPMIDDFMNFTMVWNKGISFGMLQQLGPMVLIGVTGAIVLGLIIWLFRAENMSIRSSLMLIIGGAIGNIIDRIRFGSVVDFVDVYFGDWHYPAFNFADSCIVIGVLLLLLNTLIGEKQDTPMKFKKK